MPMPGPEELAAAFYDYYHGGANYVKVARWSNSLRQEDLFIKVKYMLKLLDKGIGRKMFLSAVLNINAKPYRIWTNFYF